MIPKKIHYCWFGGKEKPAEVLRMIAGWRKHCPGYEIKEWNESNFNIHLNRYCEEAYAARKWAFVSDVARLWALVYEGGIYLDTDVEVVRPLDGLLHHRAFLGFEGSEWIATSTMGAESGNAFLQSFLESYTDRSFRNRDGSLNQTTNVEELTVRLCRELGVQLNGHPQMAGDFTILPTEFFCPYDYINGKLQTHPCTYTIHWFAQSWIKKSPLKTKLSQWWHRLAGISLK